MREYQIGTVVSVAATVFKGVAVELLNDFLFLDDFRAQFRKLQIERSAFFNAARVEQLLEDEAEVDRALEGVLVGVSRVCHQDLVLLVDAGGKARLRFVNIKSIISILMSKEALTQQQVFFRLFPSFNCMQYVNNFLIVIKTDKLL